MLVWCILFFTNSSRGSLYFSNADIHPNKAVNEKKSRKCEKQGIKNFLFLVLYPRKMWGYCQQRSICGR